MTSSNPRPSQIKSNARKPEKGENFKSGKNLSAAFRLFYLIEELCVIHQLISIQCIWYRRSEAINYVLTKKCADTVKNAASSTTPRNPVHVQILRLFCRHHFFNLHLLLVQMECIVCESSSVATCQADGKFYFTIIDGG